MVSEIVRCSSQIENVAFMPVLISCFKMHHIKGSNTWFDLRPQAGETSHPGGISRRMACTRASEDKTRAHTLDTVTWIINRHVVYSLPHITMPCYDSDSVHPQWWSWETTSEKEKKVLVSSLKLETCCLLVFTSLPRSCRWQTQAYLLIEVYVFSFYCSITYNVHVDMTVKKQKNIHGLSFCLLSVVVAFF